MPADLPTLQRSPMPRQRLSSTKVMERSTASIRLIISPHNSASCSDVVVRSICGLLACLVMMPVRLAGFHCSRKMARLSVRKFCTRARRDPVRHVRKLTAPRPVKTREELLSARLRWSTTKPQCFPVNKYGAAASGTLNGMNDLVRPSAPAPHGTIEERRITRRT